MTPQGGAWLVPVLLASSSIALAQQSPLSAQGNYSIRGVVVSAATGKPLDQAVVTISTVGDNLKIADTTTSDDGSFDFEHLRPENYALRASRRGYNAAMYEEHEGFYTGVVTGSGLDTSHLRLQLLPAAVISGTVTDDAGEPVRNAQVVLYRKSFYDGLGRIMQSAMQQTDDIGAFEFARLGPGDYFVSVSANPWYATRPQPKLDAQGNPLPDLQPVSSSLDVAYPLTFYPGTVDSDDATPIPLRAGDHVQLSFSLRAVPAVHLHLKLPGSRGQNQGITWPQVTQSVFGQQLQLSSFSPSFTPDSAELSGIPPGRYEVRFPGQNGEQDLDLAADATVVSPPADPVVDIHGKVTMMGGENPPPPSSFAVLLRSSTDNSNRAAAMAKDGAFTVQNVPAGTYDVEVAGSYSIVRMAADGASIEGHQLKLGPNPANLAIVLAADSATINGYAKLNGKAMGGVMIVLVPHDPAANREIFRRDQSDTDGSFSLKNVAPGTYTLIAIEDGWSLDWARPEVLARYLASGLKINIAFSQKTVNLPQPVEVQPR